jgi:hypothetical protein
MVFIAVSLAQHIRRKEEKRRNILINEYSTWVDNINGSNLTMFLLFTYLAVYV